MVIIVKNVFAVDVQNCRTELESRYVAWLRIFGNQEVTEETILADTSTPFITFTADADLLRPLIKNLT
jgi:hypothetical protein